jgi:hypothetical protein
VLSDVEWLADPTAPRAVSQHRAVAVDLMQEPSMDVAIDPTAGRHAGSPSGSGLSERERELLAFERQWWKFAGAKEQAIRELFDMSSTRYYQVLNALIDRQDALEFDPMLVKRLRRMRASRQRARSARRLGMQV